MKQQDTICTVFGLTIGGWVHAMGSGLGYTLMLALLTGFVSWFGTQFAKVVWHYVRDQFKN